MTTHNKLVRDKIPDICEANGAIPHIRVLEDDGEYLSALTDKWFEEGREIKEDPSLEELADGLEVLRAIGKARGYTFEQIEEARLRKVEKRGGFDERIFLISTDD